MSEQIINTGVDLQPTERLRVYDLVREVGLDISDWSNYKLPDSPAKNLKYCYQWSLIVSDRVVVCLCYDEKAFTVTGGGAYSRGSLIPKAS